MEEEKTQAKRFHAKIESGQIKVYSPHDFDYYETLATGAYGIVRKCKLKDGQGLSMENGVMTASST